MKNFTFYNPTRIYFGEGQIANLTTAIDSSKKVLILYGGGSIKKNGVYDQVVNTLSNHKTVEFSGIEPNPEFETCLKVIETIKANKVDFILAVGGGSVIDATKFIAAGVYYEGNPWDILAKGAEVTKAMPFGCVLTLPATGSEMNSGSVISRRQSGDKLVFASELVYPAFSILDPTVTYSLPLKQTINGVVDAFTHVMEQYLTYPADAPLQDRIAEGILLTLVEEGPKVIANPTDYNARANVMWCATMALNNLIRQGVPQDWTTHMLGHEITAVYGLDHAETLAIILPNVMTYKKDKKHQKLVQYAQRIWQITSGSDEDKVNQAIEKTKLFFQSLGAKVRLSSFEHFEESKLSIALESLKKHNMVALGEHQDITLEDSHKIYQMCI
ncbi:iron-containing alcohol dehydrogenase [Thiotrichales bacterium 19S3-7]|nr:iron-containing alcohol dehydrogenase [Thiotrichales bacterium 19S3-7]MCF6801982.1 iron-containing alcohol dehydrogenase [Thiotrichales bacterium 19S3-11]